MSILLLVGFSQLFAATDSLYSKAGDLYELEEYENALTLYREIVTSGYEAADLYYNMGNAAFRSNSIGYSVLYYEKALKLDPVHHDAAHNLAYLSRYRVDAFEEVPEFFIRTWISAAVHALPERTWSILALFSFVLTLVWVLLYLYTKRMALKKTGFFAALMGLILFIFTLSSAIAGHRSIIHPDSAIIISPSVVVRSTPSESGNELFILHEGTKIRVNEEVTGWQNIRIIDGREGWIPAGDFENI
ncbi:MAG: SH3 domain-containing protein [Bacteroidota bacterium]